jgi:hypothetical protein
MFPTLPTPNDIGLGDIGIVDILVPAEGGERLCGVLWHVATSSPFGAFSNEVAMLVVGSGKQVPPSYARWPGGDASFGWEGTTPVHFVHKHYDTVVKSYRDHHHNPSYDLTMKHYLKTKGVPGATPASLRVVKRTISWSQIGAAPTTTEGGYRSKYLLSNGTPVNTHGFWQDRRGPSSKAYDSVVYAWAPSTFSTRPTLKGKRYLEPSWGNRISAEKWAQTAPKTDVIWLRGLLSATGQETI